MSRDKAEEKAYKSWRKFVSDHQIWTPALDMACKIAEKQGFDRAKKQYSTSNAQLREALQSMFELVDVSRTDNREVRNKAFDKAKQLLTNTKQDEKEN